MKRDLKLSRDKKASQGQRFLNAAKELEADLDESAFEQAVKQVAKPKEKKSEFKGNELDFVKDE